MIINSKETTIAYRCPDCISVVEGIVGIFTLSGDMMKLKCSCGKSELIIERTRDRKIRLTVPCIACAKPHVYTISDTGFFERDCITFSCSYTGIDTAFLGKKERVEEEIQKSGQSLLEMFGDSELDEFYRVQEALKERADEISDINVDSIVRFMLADLEDEGKISCSCGKGPYEYEFVSGGVLIFCRECGNSVNIRLDSVLAADDFLKIDKLELK